MTYGVIEGAAVVVAMLDDPSYEAAAVDLVHAVRQVGRPFGPVAAEPVGISFGVVGHRHGEVSPVVVDGDRPGHLRKSMEGFPRLEHVRGAEEDRLADAGQAAAYREVAEPFQGAAAPSGPVRGGADWSRSTTWMESMGRPPASMGVGGPR